MALTIGRDDATGLFGFTSSVTDPHETMTHPDLIGVLPAGDQFTEISMHGFNSGWTWEVGILDITSGVNNAPLIASVNLTSAGTGVRVAQSITPVGVAGNTYAVVFRGITAGAQALRSFKANPATDRSSLTYSSPLAATFTDAGNGDQQYGFAAIATSTGPTLTAPDPTDGQESTLTTSGLTGTPSTTVAGSPLATQGSLPNLTYTLDIANITTDGQGPRLAEAVEFAVTATEGTATTNATIAPATGYAVTTITTPKVDKGGIKLEVESQQFASDNNITVGTGTQVYYSTAGNTVIEVDGTIKSDLDEIEVIIINGGNATTPAQYWLFDQSTTPIPVRNSRKAEPRVTSIAVSGGQLTLNGKATPSPCEFFRSASGGVTNTPNGEFLARIDTTVDAVIVNGVTIASPAVFFRSPDGVMTTEPNGSPIAKF